MTRARSFQRRALLAFLLLPAVLVIACAGSLSDGAGTSSVPDHASAPGTSLGADSPQAGAEANAAGERRVVITSSLDIDVEKLPEAYAQVQRIARSAGGYIAESSLSGGQDTGSATVRIRIPATLHDDVVAQVRALGLRVTREGTNSREVSEEYSDLQARIANLQRSEAQYQQLLGQARTLDEIFNINGRIETVRGQIEQAQGRAKLLDDLTDFATITVSMTVGLPVRPPVAGGIPSPVDAFQSSVQAAVRVTLVLANLTAVLLVLVMFLTPLAVLSLLTYRFGRRLVPAARRIMGP